MTPAKKIYGIIGYPVKHSLSPLMHNAAFEHLKIPAEYKLFSIEPEKLKSFLLEDILVKDSEGEFFHSKEIVGFNITIPYKVKALELASLVENITVQTHPNVVLSGAINTVKKEDGKRVYRNTDIVGFVTSLQENLKFNTAGKSAIIFGCGGASRAIVTGLLQPGMDTQKIYLYDISKEAMESMKKHFTGAGMVDYVKGRLEFISTNSIPERIKNCELLVNASPLGMKDGDCSIVDNNLLHKDLSVYDVVYNRETQLIKDARSKECRYANGLGMLLYQAAASFKIWTGEEAPLEVMREALDKGVKKL